MDKQQWDPKVYLRDAGSVPALGAPLLEILAPRAGERILDLGCGDGTLTAKIKEAGCEVLGVDASAQQIDAARARGLAAQVVDGHALPFTTEFDAVFSNAALHWMLRPAEVLAGVARALKPGGRFIAEMGGADNVASVVGAYTAELGARGIDVAPHNPWYFPTEAQYGALLRASGFEIEFIERFARPTELPGDVRDWLQLMTQTFLAAVPEATQAPLLDAVRARLQSGRLRADGVWELDYVRLRFKAIKR